MKSIYRYIQIGVYIRGYQDKETKRFVREIAQVCEFYVTEENDAKYNVLYQKTPAGKITKRPPSKYLIDYLEAQGVELPDMYKVGAGDNGVSASNSLEEDVDEMTAQFNAESEALNQQEQQKETQSQQVPNSASQAMSDFYANNPMVSQTPVTTVQE